MTANDDLMRILKFTEEELAVNRIGDVTDEQLKKINRKMREQHKQILMILFIFVLLNLFYFVIDLTAKTPTPKSNPIVSFVCLVIMLIIFVVVDINSQTQIRQTNASRMVMKIDAPIQLISQKQIRLKLWKEYFPIDSNLYHQLKLLLIKEGEDVVYRWYFLKHSGIILSVERLEATTLSLKTDEKVSDDHSK